MSYHTIVLVGRLGRDPELRFTPTGQAACTLSVATDHSYTKDGQTVKQTTWFRVTVWGKQAESANQYLAKGRQVLIEGRLNPDESGGPRVWTRQDGTPAASFEVNASRVVFLGDKSSNNTGAQSSNSSQNDDDFGDGYIDF